MASKIPDAERQYKQALRVDPRFVPALNNLAILYAQAGNFNEALLMLEKVRLIDPKDGHLAANLALVALETEHIDLALLEAVKGAFLTPTVNTKIVCAMVQAAAGYPEKAIPLYDEVLRENPKHEQAGLNICFAQTLTDAGPRELVAQRARWHSAHKQEPLPDRPHHQPSLNGKPIRVGYVSGDFKRHSASFIFGGVVLHHTPRVEPYLYSTMGLEPDKDAVTKQFKDAAGPRWRDISTLDDAVTDELIRKDRIDVLVDLSGHTGGNRLPLFTRRPAPIQVTAWGFAHGTGCPEIDWFFADPVAVPEAERCHYAEKIWDLPCIVTYNPPVGYCLKGTSRPPIRHNGCFTFGCYSRFEKLSDQCLAAFRDILLAVPDSRLELKDHAFRRPYCVRRVLDIICQGSKIPANSTQPVVDPSRLLFSSSTGHPDHMLAYQQADLILDPFPHSGGVVCLEQLWMGVPIITLYGTQAAGRTTASVLTAMGWESMIAGSQEDYIELAVQMATENGRVLTEMRKTLRSELENSPVMKGYVGAVEDAYAAMIRQKAGVAA